MLNFSKSAAMPEAATLAGQSPRIPNIANRLPIHGLRRRVASHQPARFQHREVTRQPDRQRREHDVKGDREPELDAGDQQRIEIERGEALGNRATV